MKRDETADGEILPADGEYCVVVHYSEIGLKGKNRGIFENRLRHNIARALSDTSPGRVQRYFGRLLVRLPPEFNWPAVKARLQQVFGIAHFSLAILANQDLENITRLALLQMSGKEFKSFRVTTRRGQKDYLLTSEQVNRHVGSALQEVSGEKVDLKNPELTCFIEIFNKFSLVYSEKIPGLRGLPSGVSDRAVALLSSGIDSPVAAWKMIKRGVQIVFVHFHSMPVTSAASVQNAGKLVELLTKFQFKSKLYLVPLIKIQQELMVEAPEEYRLLLFRRSMFRLAEIIASYEKADGLVTGENVAQVASQTLKNIRAINECISLPVLRPLAGEEKLDITNLAQEIGTYPISVEPYEDCCSLFVPRHPALSASACKLRFFEEHLPLEKLFDEALNGTEILKFKFPAAK